jgi:hypothetical protein
VEKDYSVVVFRRSIKISAFDVNRTSLDMRDV